MPAALALTIAIVMNAAANVCLKLSATRDIPSGATAYLRYAVTDLRLIGAVFFFGLTLFFTQSALRSLPLSVAYPIFATGVLFLVTLYSAFFFHERLSLTHLLGIALAVAAIVLLTRPSA